MVLPDTLPTLPPSSPVLAVQLASAAPGPALPAVLVAQAGQATSSAAPAAAAAATAAAASYQGSTLVVDGVAYPRAGTGNERGFAPGRLLVSPQAGRGGEIAPLMARLGLTVERALGGDPPIGWVITVPEGYERQWQAALRRQPAVAGADLDGRMTTQPVRPGGAMPVGPGVVR